MKVTRLQLDRDALKDLPRDEVGFFLAMGHLRNELTLFQRLALWSFKGSERAEPLQAAALTQAMILLRYLGARMFEGWQTLGKGFHRKAFSKDYVPSLRPEAREANEQIKKYYSQKGGSEGKRLRDQFVFHSSVDRFVGGLANTGDEDLPIFAATHASGFLFYAAEKVLNLGFLDSAEKADWESRLSRLVGSTVDLARLWILFAQGVTELFLRIHNVVLEEREIVLDKQYVPELDSVEIPWFFRADDSDQH